MNTAKKKTKKPQLSGIRQFRKEVGALIVENLPTPASIKQMLNIVSHFYIWWIVGALLLGLIGLMCESRAVLLLAILFSLTPTLLLEFTRRIAEAAGKTPEKVVNAMAVPHTWITIGIYCIMVVLPDSLYYKMIALGIVTAIMIFMTLMGRWHRPTWWYQGITMLVMVIPPIVWTGQTVMHTFAPKPYAKAKIQGAKFLNGGEEKILSKGTVYFPDKKGHPDFRNARRDTTDLTVFATDDSEAGGVGVYFKAYQGGKNPEQTGVRTIWAEAADLKDSPGSLTRAQAMAAGMYTAAVKPGETYWLTPGNPFYLDLGPEPDLNKFRRAMKTYRATVETVVSKYGQDYARIKLTNVLDQNNVLCPVLYLWVPV